MMLNGKQCNPNNFLMTPLLHKKKKEKKRKEKENEKEREKKQKKKKKEKDKEKERIYPPYIPPRGRSASPPLAYTRVK